VHEYGILIYRPVALIDIYYVRALNQDINWHTGPRIQDTAHLPSAEHEVHRFGGVSPEVTTFAVRQVIEHVEIQALPKVEVVVSRVSGDIGDQVGHAAKEEIPSLASHVTEREDHIARNLLLYRERIGKNALRNVKGLNALRSPLNAMELGWLLRNAVGFAKL